MTSEGKMSFRLPTIFLLVYFDGCRPFISGSSCTQNPKNLFTLIQHNGDFGEVLDFNAFHLSDKTARIGMGRVKNFLTGKPPIFIYLRSLLEGLFSRTTSVPFQMMSYMPKLRFLQKTMRFRKIPVLDAQKTTIFGIFTIISNVCSQPIAPEISILATLAYKLFCKGIE